MFLTKEKDLIEDAIIEAMEDMGLAIAMEQGRTGASGANEEFAKKLNSKKQKNEIQSRKVI